MQRSSVLVTAVAVVCAAAMSPEIGARAQSPPDAAFDVVSVKRNPSGGTVIRAMPGTFSATAIPVRLLIRQAYQLQEFQIVGGPDWMDRERFDVEGRFTPAAEPAGMGGPARVQAMLRTLLADRFGLIAHRESRDLPVYELVVARADRQLGPQMKPATVDCSGRRGGPPPDGRGGPGVDGRRGGGPGADGRGGPPPGAPFPAGERPPCSNGGGFGQYSARGTTMTQFVTTLSQLTGRIVVDRTGLAGGFDFDVRWTPAPDQLPPGPPPPGVELPRIDPDGPSLFTALQEQLGLKLEAGRQAVDVLVIDRLSLPAEN
jgi:uncharacterized protein (TIGR03435 family)